MSYIVEGEYNEVTHSGVTWPEFNRTLRRQGTFKFRRPQALHRLELIEREVGAYGYMEPCTTLFLTGPRVRTWGFSCAKGWVKWTDFTQKTPEGTFIAKGCGDIDPALLAPVSAKSGWWPKEPDGVLPPAKSTAVGSVGTSSGPVNRR